ncbi:Hypothetical protein NTJ_04315 [Nesidiocoris tenuis]|nr:Hypothetical protein NTJ_04315 [Nesidiocoris tenuis]
MVRKVSLIRRDECAGTISDGRSRPGGTESLRESEGRRSKVITAAISVRGRPTGHSLLPAILNWPPLLPIAVILSAAHVPPGGAEILAG